MLANDEADAVRLTLATNGWRIMQQRIAQRANMAIKALVVHPEERIGDFAKLDDRDLRALIREAEWMLTSWENEVRVNLMNRLGDQALTQNGLENPAPVTPANP